MIVASTSTTDALPVGTPTVNTRLPLESVTPDHVVTLDTKVPLTVVSLAPVLGRVIDTPPTYGVPSELVNLDVKVRVSVVSKYATSVWLTAKIKLHNFPFF